MTAYIDYVRRKSDRDRDKDAAFLAAVAEYKGQIPQDDEPPDIDTNLEWFIHAFMRLTHSRQFGMVIGPIPMTEIRCYFELFGVPDDFDLGDSLDILQAMDHRYVTDAITQHKAEQKRQQDKMQRATKSSMKARRR